MKLDDNVDSLIRTIAKYGFIAFCIFIGCSIAITLIMALVYIYIFSNFSGY